MVLASAGHGDWVLCQITSNPYGDPQAVALSESSFQFGTLRIASFARPGKLFTANDSLIVARVGTLTGGCLREIIGGVLAILDPGQTR